jgi:broad specificity phosphatase PhoE
MKRRSDYDSGATAPELRRLLRFISKTILNLGAATGAVKASRTRKQAVNARIVFISHAATEAQRRGAFPLDEPVPDQELAKLAVLGWRPPKAERIFAAPEQRAHQTARALGLTANAADALRECDYGRWRGRTMEDVQADDPEGILAWLTNPGAATHGGESIENLVRRVGVWIDEQRPAKVVIAITHPSVIRAALVHALRLPAQTFWRFDIAPLTLTDLRFSRNVWTVRCAGCRLAAQDHDEHHAEKA